MSNPSPAVGYYFFIPNFTFSMLPLAEIPYDAIAGTPAGILALRVLKADRSGELLGDAVWDEPLMMQVAREFFELVSGSPRLRELHRAAITAATLEQFSKGL